MDFNVRKADKRDIYDLVEIYHRSWQFAYRGIISDDFLDQMTLESRIARFEEMNDIPEYLYIHDSRIIGCSRLIDSRDDDLENCAEIQTIYFLPEYTGKGHGSGFIKWLARRAASEGYSHIIIWCLTDNIRANKAYEKSGFIKDNERKIKIGGKSYPETRYRLDL